MTLARRPRRISHNDLPAPLVWPISAADHLTLRRKQFLLEITAAFQHPASYLYDVNDERIALGANGATTTYPFKLYNVNGGTIYKHIFANGEPVADIKGSTSTAAVYYIHDDHLGGSSVISDTNANVAQVLEYSPFGGTRLDQRPDNTFNEQRRSDGHEFDTGTGLLYEDSRYLGPTLSRFLIEDPNFIPSGAPD